MAHSMMGVDPIGLPHGIFTVYISLYYRREAIHDHCRTRSLIDCESVSCISGGELRLHVIRFASTCPSMKGTGIAPVRSPKDFHYLSSQPIPDPLRTRPTTG